MAGRVALAEADHHHPLHNLQGVRSGTSNQDDLSVNASKFMVGSAMCMWVQLGAVSACGFPAEKPTPTQQHAAGMPPLVAPPTSLAGAGWRRRSTAATRGWHIPAKQSCIGHNGQLQAAQAGKEIGWVGTGRISQHTEKKKPMQETIHPQRPDQESSSGLVGRARQQKRLATLIKQAIQPPRTDTASSSCSEARSAQLPGASIQRTQAGGRSPRWWHFSCGGRGRGRRGCDDMPEASCCCFRKLKITPACRPACLPASGP